MAGQSGRAPAAAPCRLLAALRGVGLALPEVGACQLAHFLVEEGRRDLGGRGVEGVEHHLANKRGGGETGRCAGWAMDSVRAGLGWAAPPS